MFVMLEPADRHYYRTVKDGQTVKFPCHTMLDNEVEWARIDLVDSRRTYIYWGNKQPRGLGADPRFKVLDKNHSYSLVTDKVTVNDSAIYRCVEDAGFGNKHFFRLNVQGNFLFSSSWGPPESSPYLTDVAVLFLRRQSIKFLEVLLKK